MSFRALLELAYPAEFDFEEFYAQRTFKGRMAYVARTLAPKLGKGSSRAVFAIDDEKVLKVALNKKGIAQNRQEAQTGYTGSDLPAKVYDSDPDGIWLEMERVEPLTKAKFKQLTGLSQQELQDVLRYEQGRNLGGRRNPWSLTAFEVPQAFRHLAPHLDPRDPKHPGWDAVWDHPFLGELLAFIGNMDLWEVVNDYAQVKHYGVNRAGEIKLIDFGLSEQVWRDVYLTARRESVLREDLNREIGEIGQFLWRFADWADGRTLTVLDASKFPQGLGLGDGSQIIVKARNFQERQQVWPEFDVLTSKGHYLGPALAFSLARFTDTAFRRQAERVWDRWVWGRSEPEPELPLESIEEDKRYDDLERQILDLEEKFYEKYAGEPLALVHDHFLPPGLRRAMRREEVDTVELVHLEPGPDRLRYSPDWYCLIKPSGFDDRAATRVLLRSVIFNTSNAFRPKIANLLNQLQRDPDPEPEEPLESIQEGWESRSTRDAAFRSLQGKTLTVIDELPCYEPEEDRIDDNYPSFEISVMDDVKIASMPHHNGDVLLEYEGEVYRSHWVDVLAKTENPFQKSVLQWSAAVPEPELPLESAAAQGSESSFRALLAESRRSWELTLCQRFFDTYKGRRLRLFGGTRSPLTAYYRTAFERGKPYDRPLAPGTEVLLLPEPLREGGSGLLWCTVDLDPDSLQGGEEAEVSLLHLAAVADTPLRQIFLRIWEGPNAEPEPELPLESHQRQEPR